MVGRLTPVISITPQGLPVAAQIGTIAAVAGGGGGPPASSPRVRIANGQTNAFTANSALDDGANWLNSMGDYVDRNGVAQGSTPYAQAVISASPFTIDVSACPGDYYLIGLNSIDGAQLDGVSADAWWTDPSSNQSIPLPSKFNNPVMVRNPSGTGRSLTISTPNSVGSTLKVYQIQGPVIPDRLNYDSSVAYATPNILNLELTDAAAVITAAGGTSNIVGYSDPNQAGVAYQPSFAVDSNGLKYMEFSDILNNGAHDNVRLLSWFLPCGQITTGYMAYCLQIRSNVYTGMNPASKGLKLPGPSNDDGTVSAYNNELISLRGEHAVPSTNNVDVWGYHDYWYDASDFSGVIKGGPAPDLAVRYQSMFRANQWYHIEMFFDLGTAGVANGKWTVWINGVQVYSTTSYLFRNSSATKVSMFHINFYQGGAGSNIPFGPMNYRIAKIGVSSSRIGLPTELGTPAWRRAMTVANTVYSMPTHLYPTALSEIVDHYSGFTPAGANDRYLYWLGNAGHNSFDNFNYRLDLQTDTPVLAQIFNSTGASWTPGASYYGGAPAGCHNYWGTQWTAAVPDKVFRLDCDVLDPNANQNPFQVDAWNITAGTWDPPHTWSECPYYFNPGQHTAAYDPAHGYFFCAQGAPVQRWFVFDPTTTQQGNWSGGWPVDAQNPGGNQIGKQGNWFPFTPGNSGNSFWGNKGSCIDTLAHRWYMVSSDPPGHPWSIQWIDTAGSNWNSGNITTIALSNSDYAQWANLQFDTSMLQYDADNDRLLWVVNVNPGASGLWETHLFAIDKNSGAATHIVRMPDGAQVPAQSNTEAAINNFRYSQYWGGCFYQGDIQFQNQPLTFFTTRANR